MSLLLRLLVRGTSPRLLWPSIATEVGLVGTRCVRSRPTHLGWEVTLRLTPPATATEVERHADAVATALGIARVRTTRDPGRADRIHLALDFVPGLDAAPYPSSSEALWMPRQPGEPVPLGLDDDGNEVWLPLYGSSLLVGGSPGAGKSNALRVLLAGLARQRDTAIVGLDPKRVELSPWRERLTDLVVGNAAEPTLALLRAIVSEVQRRAETLTERGLVFAHPDAGMPSLVLVVDEWAELAADGTSKQRSEAQDHLRRYVSLGRAVGCSALLATQRPTSDTVDTGTRALLAYRLALRCGDRWQSEAILGNGHTQAATISIANPGRGFLASGDTPHGVQVFDLPPALIATHLASPLQVPKWW